MRLRRASGKCRAPPRTGHLPPAASKGLSSALLRQVVELVHKEGGRGDKMKGEASNYQQLAREASVQGKHLPRHASHAMRRPLPTTLPASQARAL